MMLGLQRQRIMRKLFEEKIGPGQVLVTLALLSGDWLGGIMMTVLIMVVVVNVMVMDMLVFMAFNS